MFKPMSPFEAAAGCDVLRPGSQYPDLRISGGFLPTCDHGVPEEVSIKNYLHFRKRCL